MRELKFRAWVNKQNKMVYDNDYWTNDFTVSATPKSCNPVKITNFGIVYCPAIDRSEPYLTMYSGNKQRDFYCNWEFDRTHTDVVLMQFTGLHDKNGKEVYENDVVRIAFNNQSTEIGGIVWSSELHRFMFVGEDGKWGFDNKTIVEVIGNIHESPELLPHPNKQEG